MEEARGCLVLDLKCLNVQEGESSSVGELDSPILGKEAHFGLYREVRNVAMVSKFIVAGQLRSSICGSYTHL